MRKFIANGAVPGSKVCSSYLSTPNYNPTAPPPGRQAFDSKQYDGTFELSIAN